MNLRRVGILFLKEVVQGPKNYLVILALVVPVAITLLVTLVFGSFFSGKSRLGLVDEGGSALPALAGENKALSVRAFSSGGELRDAVARGAVDVGIVLPPGFDENVRSGAKTVIQVFAWGESQMRHRIILSAAVIHAVRQIAGQEAPVEIATTVLGSGANIPWEQRLMPLMVLMSIMFSGMIVPATSLVTEKMKRTISALAVSPATLLDVFAAKGLLGVGLSMVSALLILFMNRAFGTQPGLLLGVLLLGAVFSAALGVAVGAAMKDVNTLFATFKGTGIFLYGPAFVYMFPEIPQWIGRIFPTYYVIQPVLEITQKNASLAEIAPELGILAGLILVMFAILVVLARRTQETQAAA